MKRYADLKYKHILRCDKWGHYTFQDHGKTDLVSILLFCAILNKKPTN